MLHRFWTCQHSARFWQLLHSEKGVSVAIPPSPIDSQSALASWLLGWFTEAAEEEKAAMIQAAYGLWLARNEARDGQRISPPHEIIEKVAAHMKEWKEAHISNPRPAMPQLKQKWRPPDTGWLKVNSDGAVAKVRNSGGAGAVIRDHEGAFRAGLCHFFRDVVDPESVEIFVLQASS